MLPLHLLLPNSERLPLLAVGSSSEKPRLDDSDELTARALKIVLDYQQQTLNNGVGVPDSPTAGRHGTTPYRGGGIRNRRGLH